MSSAVPSVVVVLALSCALLQITFRMLHIAVFKIVSRRGNNKADIVATKQTYNAFHQKYNVRLHQKNPPFLEKKPNPVLCKYWQNLNLVKLHRLL